MLTYYLVKEDMYKSNYNLVLRYHKYDQSFEPKISKKPINKIFYLIITGIQHSIIFYKTHLQVICYFVILLMDISKAYDSVSITMLEKV